MKGLNFMKNNKTSLKSFVNSIINSNTKIIVINVEKEYNEIKESINQFDFSSVDIINPLALFTSYDNDINNKHHSKSY